MDNHWHRTLLHHLILCIFILTVLMYLIHSYAASQRNSGLLFVFHETNFRVFVSMDAMFPLFKMHSNCKQILLCIYIWYRFLSSVIFFRRVFVKFIFKKGRQI